MMNITNFKRYEISHDIININKKMYCFFFFYCRTFFEYVIFAINMFQSLCLNYTQGSKIPL